LIDFKFNLKNDIYVGSISEVLNSHTSNCQCEISMANAW